MSESGEAGPVFAETVKELVASEEQRRTSLEGRGTSVITVSGTLVTLLLGLAALLTKRDDFRLESGTRDLLTAAVVAFAVSALLAIAVSAPHRERVVDPSQLGAELRELWERDADFARKKTTATRLELLAALQRANDRRAWALLAAVAAQVCAVALLALAVAQLI